MKSILLFLLSSVLVASCNNSVHIENTDDAKHVNQQSTQKITWVDRQEFENLLKTFSSEAMRREGQKHLAELTLKYNQSEKLPLNLMVKLFESLLENHPFLKHDEWLFDLSKVYLKIDEKTLALNTLDKFLALYSNVNHLDEIQFVRAGVLFELHQFKKSEQAYKQVIEFRNSAHYEQAVYRQGWAQLKQAQYGLALNSFMHLLDVHSGEGGLLFKSMGPAEKKFIDKILLAINLSFDSQAGARTAQAYFSNRQKRQYEYHVFVSLAEFYQHKNKISEAVKTYRLFVELNPLHVQSPVFLLKVIDLYQKGGFENELIDAQKDFVLRYPVTHVYWRLHAKNKASLSMQVLKKTLLTLANSAYTLSKKENNSSGYRQVERWSRLFLNAFPEHENANNISFQLAETLRELELFEMAALQYERTAYDFKNNAQAADAAYIALLMYENRLKELSGFEKKYWRNLFVDSARRFVKAFPEHAQVASLKHKLAKSEYAFVTYGVGQYDSAFKFLGARDWNNAAVEFKSSREINVKQKLKIEITKKLALIYIADEAYSKAITELRQVSYFNDESNHQFDYLWLAAEFSELINDNKLAVKLYTSFIKRFPFLLQRTIQARQRVIEIYERTGEYLLATQWRVELVNADAKGGGFRTHKTRSLAAKSRLILAEPLQENYRNVSLYAPLVESLKEKSSLMNEAITAYKIAASYNVFEVLTVATYRVAELQINMSQAIIDSERPDKLSQPMLKKYEAMLNKKAQVFKDNAIKYHKINASRAVDNLNDVWVRKSVERLKVL